MATSNFSKFLPVLFMCVGLFVLMPSSQAFGDALTITIGKAVGGRLDPADQFTVTVTGSKSATPISSVTTTGSRTSVTATQTSTPQTLTLTDAMAAGSPSPLSSYETLLTCTNANTSSSTTLPAANSPTASASFAVTAQDDITCIFTNTPKATLTKAFSAGSIVAGQPATLTFTIANPVGAPARTGFTFTDTFPAGLVIAGTPNVVNSCGGTPTITATAGTGTFSVGGTGVNAAAGASTCTVSVDVTSTTPASYVNGAAQITAISSSLINGVTDQTLNVAPPTSLTVLKYAFGVTSGASAKPGQEIPYMITVSNTGAGVAGNVVVQDCLSPYSAWTLNTFAFTDGAAPSGLSLTGSTMYYSSDNGATWTTTPPADDGTGHAPAVTCWKLVMDPANSMNPTPASFTLNYQAKVK